MSDDDLDMMYDDDDFLDEDDGEEGDEGFEIENEYYNAKGMLDEDISEAIAGYERVVEMEEEKGEWGFKALKKLIKLYLDEGDRDKAVVKFEELMSYTQGAVSANIAEKGIAGVLDSIATSKPSDADEDTMGDDASAEGQVVERLYEIAISVLRKQGSERVWFRQALKYAKILMENGNTQKLIGVLEELHASCRGPDGQDDPKKGSQLVDIYAVEIQLHTELKNNARLKQLYYKALSINSAIPHPRILGTIRECGAKMHMREHNWDEAFSDFFDAFKNYDEAGSPRRIACLKYWVLASLLANMAVDPFDSTESKPYKSHPEIVPMDQLKDAHHANDVAAFEKVLKLHKKTILEDNFIKEYIPQLMRIMRIRVLKNLLKPYQSIAIPFVASELNIPSSEVEELMVELVLDGEITGKIDQINQVLVLDQQKGNAFFKYRAMENFASNFGQVQVSLLNRMT
jgi:COP9 signalosome complex subunit 2